MKFNIEILKNLIFFLITSSLCAAEIPSIRIGFDRSFPPFSEIDMNGNLQGIDVDTAKKICDQINYKCEYVPIESDQLVSQLRAKTVDVIYSGLIDFVEINKDLSITKSHVSSPAKFARLGGSGIDFSINDISGLTVAVIKDSPHDEYLTEKFADHLEIVRLKTLERLFEDTVNGRSNLIFGDSSAILSYELENNLNIKLIGPNITDVKYFGEGTNIIVRKENYDLIDKFNSAIERLAETSAYQEISGGEIAFDVSNQKKFVSKEILIPNSEYSSNNDGIPIYRVWYGTNRKPLDPSDHTKGYSNEYDSKIHYGHCYIEIPESHIFGSTGSSWIRRLVTFQWEDDSLNLRSIRHLSVSNWHQRLINKLKSRDTGKRDLLIYIHGYNVTFEDAAIRAAQIGYDLGIEGVTSFFSWPSKGGVSPLAYASDGATINASELHLEKFLLRLIDRIQVGQIHILAHSMGNRGLLRVIERVSPQLKSRISQIILAAPDVDKRVFENIAKIYSQVAERTTMYVSAKDLALGTSSLLHNFPRAGFYPPVTTVEGIDTISVTDFDLSILGHSYFAEAHSVLADIQLILRTNLDPINRLRLQSVSDYSQSYWEFSQ